MLQSDKMSQYRKTIIIFFLFFYVSLQAEEINKNPLTNTIQQKSRFSFIAGKGVDYIARGEYWIKHKPSFLDFKARVEHKNAKAFQKYRLQFMPLVLNHSKYGIALRYLRKEGKDGIHGIGVAFKLWGQHWKLPFRYYPDLKLIHTKPQIKYDKLRIDCQVINYHEKKKWSLRPGIDWNFIDGFSMGIEGRLYSESKKNYIGMRLRWKIKY